ncbi:MAG: hypothetical protein K9H64_06500 [Bacteroidales bacterium]|nr:hypothetical protein [Bacteroidales bacterium]MCF8455347.1 hypothetical protein [Bacteroidales bacterium]
MIAVNGTYENGIVRLGKKIKFKSPRKVVVTFLEDEVQDDPKRLSVQDFSFLKAREKSKKLKSSLSDAIIEERKAEL